jgi:acyl-CoA synthetase (AMP-forming)/AMP-acid ligase II
MAPSLDTDRIGVRPSLGAKLRAFARAGRMTSATFTDFLADLYGDRTCFLLDRPLETPYFEGSVISYRALNALVRRTASVLASLGVRRGDRVALCTANRIELAFVEFAAQRLGAVPVPLNFMLTRGEMAGLVRRSGARVMVVDRSVYKQSLEGVDLRAELGSVERWVMVTAKDPPPGFERFDALMAAAREDAAGAPADVADADPAVIFFTAGTTGLPKGAVLTSGALMYALRRYVKVSALRPTSRTNLSLMVMPLAHIGGHQALLIQMALASPMLLMSTFDPERILDLIERHRVTTFAGIPTMFRMLLAAGAERRDLSSVRLWGGGGDAFPTDLVRTFKRLSPRGWFVTGYGLAETAGQLTINPLGLGDACVGWFLPGVRARLVDESGRDVKAGEVGELVVKTPSIMQGYWDDAEATKKSIEDGWFRTGDLMKKGKYGLHYFVAREKDMIKVSGYSVFPAEVEAILETHPDVEQSVVVGLPHPVKGTLPVAAVVRRDGAKTSEEELHVWAKDKVARYRCPRRIVFVDAIALNQAMKPLRRQVRADLLEMGVEVESFAEQRPRERSLE